MLSVFDKLRYTSEDQSSVVWTLTRDCLATPPPTSLLFDRRDNSMSQLSLHFLIKSII
jgi:hypothetical protein